MRNCILIPICRVKSVAAFLIGKAVFLIQPPGVTATHQILILGLQVQILWGLLRVARITAITADS